MGLKLIKKKRGNKICPICGQGNGARSFHCKSCDYKFTVNKSKKKSKVSKIDWTKLVKGDKIKVIGGSGPYYEDKEGNRHYLTDRGVYYVLETSECGLHVRSAKGGDIQFLYMGLVYKSNLCFNLFKSPHKIVLL